MMGGKGDTPRNVAADIKPLAVTPEQVAAATAPLTEQSEGYVPHAYQDSAGVWTIGWGSTRDISGRPVTAFTPDVTEAQAKTMLERDLISAVMQVAEYVKAPINLHQWAALSDFVYNVGAGNFLRSTVLKLLNAGKYAEAAKHLEDWDMAGGRPLAGLLRRRQAEEAMFDTPVNKQSS